MRGQYLIAGVGGQGVVTAASVLSRVATNLGFEVLGSETHGMSQRGGSVVSHWKVGDFAAPLICKGAADCLIAFNAVEGYRNLDFLRSGGNAVFNAPVGGLRPEVAAFLDEQGVTYRAFDALAEVAREKRYKSLNQMVLGFVAGCGWFPFAEDDLRSVVHGFGKPQFREANVWAFERGVELAREDS
ncbi:MAG: 2-oxoacid:acceptor oxidoreductase family protein [Myxococcota bacterium]|jgi:indolepyruvate ferredoxin oxidoreductase beta subunit|nr:2-oxoacid:acceptor oxidoreductase family protein [Myxococcota bacterium]